MVKNNTIRHLIHSSNALKIGGRLLIFDYPISAAERPEGAGLEDGFIDPGEIAEEEVYLFISHAHADHFTPDIFLWNGRIDALKYVLSSDITGYPQGALALPAGTETEIDGMKVVTHPSTDCGVAFSILIDGRHIYFAGDNAFWNWDNDRPDQMYIDILSPISKVGAVDLAFQVCDPRLEDRGTGGIYIFAQFLNPKLLVPIHSFGQYEINAIAETELRRIGFKGHYWRIGGRGESTSFNF